MNKIEELFTAFNDGKLRGAQAKVAKSLDTSTANIARYANGSVKPSRDILIKMSKLFGKSMEELREIFGFPPQLDLIKTVVKRKINYIPILGTSSATDEHFIVEEKLGFLAVPLENENEYAIQVVGNCMVDPSNPQDSIYNGQYAIINPALKPQNGDVVVAKFDGERSTIKRLYVDGDNIILKPDNPQCRTLKYKTADNIKIEKVAYIYRPTTKKLNK